MGQEKKKTFLAACLEQMDLGFGAEDGIRIAFLTTPTQLLSY